MSRKHVDEEHLTVTGAHRHSQPPGITVQDDVLIVVTQAFCPNGHNMVGASDVNFDGNPAVTLRITTDDEEGLVHLSPIHGDKRKSGLTDIEPGTKCRIHCPTCGTALPKVGEVDDGSGAEYVALYLTAKRDQGVIVAISDVWGHYHSRVVDDNELISYWATTHPDS